LNKVLIVYGSNYGATAGTSEEIATVMRKEGLDVRLVDAKKEKISDISEYDLVLVGSGIEIGKWHKEIEAFLKGFQKDLVSKKLALFVSCGASSIALNNGNPEEMAKNKETYLDKEAAKFGLTTVAYGFFGGIYDYNKIPIFAKLIMRRSITPKVKSAFKENTPRVYDTRNMDEVRNWTADLVKKVKE
jgi:menaquinone-dependent protoporphyrinogen oxidase